MDNEKINKHVDFREIFKELFEEHKSELEKFKKSEMNKTLLGFVESGDFDDYELMLDECEIYESHIRFVFGKDLEQPNESSSYVASGNYFIFFDRVLNEFTICDYEQG